MRVCWSGTIGSARKLTAFPFFLVSMCANKRRIFHEHFAHFFSISFSTFNFQFCSRCLKKFLPFSIRKSSKNYSISSSTVGSNKLFKPWSKYCFLFESKIQRKCFLFIIIIIVSIRPNEVYIGVIISDECLFEIIRITLYFVSLSRRSFYSKFFEHTNVPTIELANIKEFKKSLDWLHNMRLNNTSTTRILHFKNIENTLFYIEFHDRSCPLAER